MKTAAIALAAAALGLLVGAGAMRSSTGADTYQVPRTADGKPNLNGIWQAMNTANWDIQDHAARPGPGGRARRGVQRARRARASSKATRFPTA